jgi:hypothetical protein
MKLCLLPRLVRGVVTVHPIHFTAEMRTAIRAGRKTQTRRVIKNTGLYAIDERIHGATIAERERWKLATQCPYGQPGGWLWMHEPLMPRYVLDDTKALTRFSGRYLDDKAIARFDFLPRMKWVPCNDTIPYRGRTIPPEWARDWLHIDQVRVQRLQEISEDDAKAEGVELDRKHGAGWIDYSTAAWRGVEACINARDSFRSLWYSINSKRDFGWLSNPWVWAITFTYHRIKPGKVTLA